LENLYINRWITGLYVQRSPLVAPVSYIGQQQIIRHDALIDGLNMELKNDFTIRRRPGTSKYSTVQLANDEIIRSFYSFRDVTNSVRIVADTDKKVSAFTTSARTDLYSPTTGRVSFVNQAGYLYFTDGGNNKKWNGTTVTNWGISRSANTPLVVAHSGGNNRLWQKQTALSANYSIKDPNANYQFVTTAGTTGKPSFPAWQETVGAITADGTTVRWTCGGELQNWTPSTSYINNQVITDSNGNLQVCTVDGGVSDTFEPLWGTSVGATTTDGTISWVCLGSNLIVAQTGFQYAYAYHTTSGHVSSISPIYTTGPIIGASALDLDITGNYSSDTQCDYIWLFRTKDGGATLFYVDQIANNPAGSTWTYRDQKDDAQLNTAIVAPTESSNLPPVGFQVAVVHTGRIFGAKDNILYYGGGGEITTGRPDESFDSTNTFTFPDRVTALAPMKFGLLVFTPSKTYILRGLDPDSYFVTPWRNMMGALNQNALAIDGDTLYILTAQAQLLAVQETLIEEIGYPIGENFFLYADRSRFYLTVLRDNAAESALYVSDGGLDGNSASGTIGRFNLNTRTWSPGYQYVGSSSAVGVVETGNGAFSLLIGRANTSGYILKRDTSVLQDDGSNYANTFVVIGSLVLAPPGKFFEVDALVVETDATGTYPTVSYRPNEISGLFTTLANSVADNPEFPASSTIAIKRFYLNQASISNLARFIQVKVAFAQENVQNILYGLGVDFLPHTTDYRK